MPAYVVVDITIHDPVGYEEYKKLAPAAVAAYGGKYIARGGAVETLRHVVAQAIGDFGIPHRRACQAMAQLGGISPCARIASQDGNDADDCRRRCERVTIPRASLPPITRRGAMCVVFSEDRVRVLLLRREVFVLWDLPGGGIEPDEDPAEAAVRETREESGYDVTIERFVGTYRCQSVYSLGDQLTYVFRARVTGGIPKRFGLETTGLRWFPVNALPRGVEPLQRQMIADALADLPAPVERRIEFARWKLYPARIIFFVMRVRNITARRIFEMVARQEIE